MVKVLYGGFMQAHLRQFQNATSPGHGRAGSAPTAAGVLHHADFGGPIHYQGWDQPANDEEATAQTIALMSHFAREDAYHETLRTAALAATAAARTPQEAAAGIWQWIRSRVQYVEDSRPALGLDGIAPADAEVLIRPVDLLAMPQPMGDCDDFSMLCASMLLAVDIEPHFKTIAAEPGYPDQYSHVFVAAVLPGGQLLPLDCSHGPAPGWEAPATGKSRLWPVLARPSSLSGVGAIDWGKILESGVEIGGTIAKERFGQPPAGTYRQGADGSVLYRQQPGSGPLAFPGVGIGSTGGIGTLLLIVGGIALVAMMAKR